MAKILSVEIGNSLTRVCEMDFKVKNPKVYKYFSFPTPQGVLEDGFVQESPEFVLALKTALHDNGVKTKSVVFSVASTKIVTREVSVPTLKPSQLATFIKANANDYFPIDLSMYEVAHVVLGTDTSDESGSKQRVMVMAAGKDLIAGYVQLASNCGLKLNCIDYSGNSVYQVMKAECADETSLVVRIEESSTVASVISNGSLVLQRSLAYGIERCVRAVMDSHEFYESEYGPALKLLCQKPIAKVVLNDRTKVLERDEARFESDQNEEARTRVTATFTQLLGNLVRVIELYNSKEPLNPIRKVVLTGIGAEIMNLSKLFHNEIGLATSVLTEVSSVTVVAATEENLGRYIGAIGAGIEPVGLMTTDVKSKEKKAVNYGLLTVIALLVIILVLVGLFLKAYLPYRAEQKEEKRLKDLEASYQQAEIVHKQYLSVESLYNEVIGKFALTESSNDGIIAFLTDMETNLPSDIKLVSFSSNNESAVLTIHVADFEEAGKVLQILRDFDSLRTVTIAGIDAGEVTEETEEDPGFDMTVTCLYYPNGSSELEK